MKKSIKINFSDFYTGFQPNNNGIYSILNKYYDIEISEKPDFLFYNCYAQNHLRYNEAIKIFCCGENIRADFNVCDYAMTYDRLNFNNRHHRNMMGTKKPDIKLDNLVDRKFCNFIYSNNYLGNLIKTRNNFCLKLAKYKHVDCPGKVLNNMKNAISLRYDGNWVKSKLDFIKNYKFTIAFENSMASGYITEKLKHPFLCNTIPIYMGDPDVTLDFNPKAFINCNDFKNFDEVVEYIEYLDNNDDAYMAMLHEPAMQPDFDWENDKIDKFLISIIENGSPQPKDGLGIFSTHRYYFLISKAINDIVINPLAKELDTYSIIKNITYTPGNKSELINLASKLKEKYISNSLSDNYLKLILPNDELGNHRRKILKSALENDFQTPGCMVFCQDSDLEDEYRNLYNLIWPHDLEGCQKIRIGNMGGGGAVLYEPQKNGLAISIDAQGRPASNQRDLELAQRGLKVIQFYGKPIQSTLAHENINFNLYNQNLFTTDCIQNTMNLNNSNNYLLFMDLEGKEYNLLPQLDLDKFTYIYIEFHRITISSSLPILRYIIEKILDTHISIHAHFHNYGKKLCFKDFLVPSIMEITFARRDLGKFNPSRCIFPTELDIPNIPTHPEVYMGKFTILTGYDVPRQSQRIQ